MPRLLLIMTSYRYVMLLDDVSKVGPPIFCFNAIKLNRSKNAADSMACSVELLTDGIIDCFDPVFHDVRLFFASADFILNT